MRVDRIKLFRFFHRYLYCDEIKLEADNVLATLYTAKKYLVPHLAQACVRFLETSLNHKNACILLSQSCLFEENDLKRKCWEVCNKSLQEFIHLNSITFRSISFRLLHLPSNKDNHCIYCKLFFFMLIQQGISFDIFRF